MIKPEMSQFDYNKPSRMTLLSDYKEILRRDLNISIRTFLRQTGQLDSKHPLFKKNELNIVNMDGRWYIDKADFEKYYDKVKQVQGEIQNEEAISIDEYAKDCNLSRRSIERRVKKGEIEAFSFKNKTYCKKGGHFDETKS